jgi:hypothetical protein
VHCEDRDRLTEIYLAAIRKHDIASLKVPDMKSEAWREATKETREACQEALAELNIHRQEHGC